ncbi:MAG: N-acetyl-gamma-glutamyl-phosphate reductase [Desulfobacteraceae bacterium]|nr:N-acetyl-gamma-glutamyl-phosphate reductase [Desulfobacteraceae bacterium]
MIKVGIIGATGYTGAELIKLIFNHPDAELSIITSKTFEGKPISDVFPVFNNIINQKCQLLDVDTISEQVDVVFLCLPHKISMEYAPKFFKNGIKVIDLSADYRFNSVSSYESVYQKHTSTELFEFSAYGLSEIYNTEIKNAQIIGNPGCYPTSLLLPMIPLVKEKVIDTNLIISDSKSGVSGAGRSATPATHFCETNESFKPYKVGNHRHTPEMEEKLTENAGQDIKITFVPHLLPLTRGMLTTIYTNTKENITRVDLEEIFNNYYGKKYFVRILQNKNFPDILSVKGTNFCDIGFYKDDDSEQLIIVSAIDNLLKGAAGQAVQNMNIIFNFNECLGLDKI